MADEELSAAQSELETPAIATEQETETAQPETEIDGEEPEVAEEDEGGAEPAEELEEIEIDGQTYQVPKALKGSFMKSADYTQKSQANADRGRALETREAEIEERAKATDEELDNRAALRGVTARLAEYAKLTPEDWQAHMLSDPLGTQQHRMAFEDLRNQKADLEGKISTAQSKRTEATQQDLAKRVQETLAAAPTIIPGTTEKTIGPAIDKLVNFATSAGIPEQALKANWSPTLLKVLHLASLGQQVMDKQSAPKPKPAPAPAPVKVISAKSNPTNRKSPSEMSMAETAEAFRKEQAARKAS